MTSDTDLMSRPIPHEHASHMHAVPDAPRQDDTVVLSIVMPAYNEARTIRSAVDHVLGTSYPCEIELVVVDDGSHDGTADLLDDITDERLTVTRHVRNMGKGAAVLTGISVARGTHLMPFDADMEYSAHDVAALVQPVIDGRTDVVYGTRLFGQNTVYRSYRYKFGNRAMTFAANVLFDSAISDLHTCLKLVPLPMLRSMELTELGFGLDTEITANVLRLGERPFEVPISYHSRSHADGKKINWRDAVRCIQVLGRVRMAPDNQATANAVQERASRAASAPRFERKAQSLRGGGSMPVAVAVSRSGEAAGASRAAE
ncbi:glycosyltransferase family 2 protein [Solicola sp. PLA-1-18]|uniref:glycosyltransferase family 2 protein n=1 Tax=Solicola sp. PLA-1-18 TaxID=3380532 RepID=UPI003B82AD43